MTYTTLRDVTSGRAYGPVLRRRVGLQSRVETVEAVRTHVALVITPETADPPQPGTLPGTGATGEVHTTPAWLAARLRPILPAEEASEPAGELTPSRTSDAYWACSTRESLGLSDSLVCNHETGWLGKDRTG